MKHKKLLWEYTSRLIHQTSAQVTGVLGFGITALLDLLLPDEFITWVYYSIVLVAGLIVGSYSVFAELAKELKVKEDEHTHAVSNFEQRIHQLEDAQPSIHVDIQDKNHQLVEILEIQLGPLPPEPDFDAIVEEERQRLLAKQPPESSPVAAWSLGSVKV